MLLFYSSIPFPTFTLLLLFILTLYIYISQITIFVIFITLCNFMFLKKFEGIKKDKYLFTDSIYINFFIYYFWFSSFVPMDLAKSGVISLT